MGINSTNSKTAMSLIELKIKIKKKKVVVNTQFTGSQETDSEGIGNMIAL